MPISKRGIPVWYRIILTAGLAICILISIKPKVILGIGIGSGKISKWKIWYQFLGVILPGLIFGGFIWPYIEQTIRNFFNR